MKLYCRPNLLVLHISVLMWMKTKFYEQNWKFSCELQNLFSKPTIETPFPFHNQKNWFRLILNSQFLLKIWNFQVSNGKIITTWRVKKFIDIKSMTMKVIVALQRQKSAYSSIIHNTKGTKNQQRNQNQKDSGNRPWKEPSRP